MKLQNMYLCMQCEEVMEHKKIACPACGSARLAPVCGWVTSFTVAHQEAMNQAMLARTKDGADVVVDLLEAVGL
jgi:RNA polymerase subunit RPABC4/transcription elongation factor Spt4